ncbi:MAG: prephenate dehydrogenase [Oscillospiraceae bacterium]|nr:prephenate dehydrogenase [Oscillospiraceae bacterium]MDE7171352.1 prephenate dehydrogenase [Oscillospiraceae bacterium]
MKKILVVGLGLIGGSLAMALQGFEDYEVVGAARSQSTYDKAVAKHAANRVTFDPATELPGADVVILCQDPAGIIGFLRDNRDHFKPGCLVLDVCGVKTAVMEAATKYLPDGVDFIGCHPMAGKEVSGIDNAEGTLFRNTHFIVTPGPRATAEHLDLLHRMAEYCQFGDVIETTPERHDEMIAYTSQMMHVIAVSVCDNEELFSCVGFEGGSFRDCTRVAALDPAMWTQLFTLNAPALSKMVSELEERIHQYRVAIENNDRETLRAMLTSASNRKKQINLERARGDDVRPKF